MRRKSETEVGDSRLFGGVQRNYGDPRWREQFALVFHPNFDARGRLLIGPPCSTLSWERIQTKLGKDVAVGVSQLYFDGAFMGPSTGIESGYIASLNLRSAAKFQQESVKMFALIPTYDKMLLPRPSQKRTSRNEKWRCTKPS